MLRVIFSIFFGCSFLVFSQIGMQQWRIHFSAYDNIGIAQTNEAIFMAAANGVVEYNKSDNSLSTMTVINGLSDLGISTIAANEDVLVVGYENGNLDILENNRITNLPFIKTAEISGSKRISNISFSNNLIYVSTEIGLVVVDNERKEIKDTYYPYESPIVNDAAVINDTLFVATEKGLFYALENAVFLNNFENWTKYTALPATVVNGPFKELERFNNALAIVYKHVDFAKDTLYFLKEGNLSYYNNYPLAINEIKTENEKLILTQFSSIEVIGTDFLRADLIFDYPLGSPLPTSTVFYDGHYYISDLKFGLVKAINSYSASSIYSNSPFSDGCYRLEIQYGKLIVAGGSLTTNLVNTYQRNGIYIFEDEEWLSMNYFNQDSISEFKDFDFVSAAINPNNTNEFAFSSISQGGLKWVKDGVRVSEVYTPENSILEYSGSNIAIPDMKFDNDGNLWVVNSGLEPLKMFAPDGSQYSFSLGSSAKNKYPYRLTIDSQNRKWVAIYSVGVVVFDDHGTFDDTSDDELQTLTTAEGYGNLPSFFCRAIAEDIDGEIWIGTEEGLVVLANTSKLFDGGFGEYDANAILLQVDGEVEELFGKTSITAIAVDGGNRKWIGTSASGVFCVSPDGYDEVYRFTAENSPLISNNILDIRINYQTGEVYFATEAGLVSFRSDATIGDEEFSNISVFPNPVRPDYSGPISVQGIGYESDVTITDVAGNVVYKTISNGGTVVWDGKTLQGERAKSGVYLVWAASTNGKGKVVAKILMIN